MSHPPRFFIEPTQVTADGITIAGDDLRHIRTVLRKQPGDRLTLLDGRGAEYTVSIVELGKEEIRTAIVDRRLREPLRPVVVLGQGIAKADKMDWIVQKAAELGVSSVVPLVTERTIVKVKDEEKRVGRWRKIAREAAMQSARPDIPTIEPIRSYKDFLRTPRPDPRTLLLLPWEEAGRPIKDVLRQRADADPVVVLIGPEGGFSQAEADLAKDQGFHAVSLGSTILRTETAAIAVVSMISYELRS